jgi:hypothetical protein
MPEVTKLTKMDVESISAKLEVERQMVYLKIQPLASAKTEIPELGITIGQAHELITHLKKMVDAFEILRPYTSYTGVQIVDEG